MDLKSWLNARLATPRVDAASQLPGREAPMFTQFPAHEVFGRPIDEVNGHEQVAYFALGCYWGAEKVFWNTQGVTNSAVGFMGGFTQNPTYRETCTGRTGHTETVRVVFDPSVVSYADLVTTFFEHHDPTQSDRQGSDVGTQYRSAVFATSDDQATTARAIADAYQRELTAAGFGAITTGIEPSDEFYYAEADHQQYLDKNPDGYDCRHATGVACPLSKTGA